MVVIASIALIVVAISTRRPTTADPVSQQARGEDKEVAAEGDGNRQRRPEKGPAPAKKRRADGIPVDAIGLMALYENNGVEADRLVKGEWLIITGEIHHIGKDVLGNRYVALVSHPPDKHSVFEVQCFFKAKHDAALAKLSPGEECRIRGRCQGRSLNVIVKDCELLPADGPEND